MPDLTPEQEQEKLRLIQQQNVAANELLSTYEKLSLSAEELKQEEKELLSLSKQLFQSSIKIEVSLQKRSEKLKASVNLSKLLNQLTLNYNKSLSESINLQEKQQKSPTLSKVEPKKPIKEAISLPETITQTITPKFNVEVPELTITPKLKLADVSELTVTPNLALTASPIQIVTPNLQLADPLVPLTVTPNLTLAATPVQTVVPNLTLAATPVQTVVPNLQLVPQNEPLFVTPNLKVKPILDPLFITPNLKVKPILDPLFVTPNLKLIDSLVALTVTPNLILADPLEPLTIIPNLKLADSLVPLTVTPNLTLAATPPLTVTPEFNIETTTLPISGPTTTTPSSFPFDKTQLVSIFKEGIEKAFKKYERSPSLGITLDKDKSGLLTKIASAATLILSEIKKRAGGIPSSVSASVTPPPPIVPGGPPPITPGVTPPSTLPPAQPPPPLSSTTTPFATTATVSVAKDLAVVSEQLLDSSNQIIDSTRERSKLLKGITAEEQLYLSSIKQQQKLSQNIAANAEDYLNFQIKSKDLDKQITTAKSNANKADLSFAKIEQKLSNDRKQALLNAISLKNQEKRLQKDITDLDEKTAELSIQRQSAVRVGNTSLAKSLSDRIKSNQQDARILEKSLKDTGNKLQREKNIAKSSFEILKQAKESKKFQSEEIALLEKNQDIRKRIEKSTGLLGGMSKALAKIPGIGQYLNADEAIKDMEKMAAEIENAGGKSTSFSNRLKIGLKGASTLVKGLTDNLKSPEAIFTFIISQGLKANSQSVQLGKSLGLGADKADKFRENLAEIARNSTNINVTAENLVGAFNELSDASGFVANYSKDTLETQIMLTKQFGLTGEEAAGIYKFSILTGQSTSQVNKNMVGAFVSARNSLKVGADFKKVMAEASKVTGQLAANFKNSPEAITKAIVQAQALGTTLEQTKNQGEKLLDFESSLENELKAELLTGQQINLERARAAALQGDQVTVMKELANQGMTLNKFQGMNVLAQKSFAEAIGLSADELAKQLEKQKLAQESGKSLAQITKDEALEAQKRQSVQDKFNAAILKLQDFFGNLIAGPVGQLLEAFTNIVGVIQDVLQPILSVVFTPISWAVKGLQAMLPILKVIAGTYAVIKGYQLLSIGYQSIQLGLSTAAMSQTAIRAGMETSIVAVKETQLLLDNESFLTKLSTNAALLFQLVREQGIAGIKAFVLGLDEQSLVKKAAMAVYDGFAVIRAGALAGFAAFRAAAEKSIIISLIRQGVIMVINLGRAIATAVAQITGASAATLGIAAGLALAAGAAAYAFLNSKKAGDVLSPSKGKTQISTKEGELLELSPNDDVVAAPGAVDAFQNKDNTINTSITGEKGGGGGSNEAMMALISTMTSQLQAQIASTNAVKASVDKLYAKDQSINMDGTKVGTTLTQGSHKVA